MNKKIQIIAHAGAKGIENENTLAAFKKAIDYGADMIEIDVRYHDNKCWVFHDRRLERLTPLKGRLEDHNSTTLRKITFANNQGIPYLEEAIEYIDKRLPINIEIKSLKGINPIAKLITHYLNKGWSPDDFLLSSFNHVHLKQLETLVPTVKTAALSASIPLSLSDFTKDLKNCIAINQSISYINQALIDHAHNNGLKVYVFTVNHQEDLNDLQELGIDGIFTDHLFPGITP
ncbi:MAG: glycerophosphodiester phosphodiesterase [bacterium]